MNDTLSLLLSFGFGCLVGAAYFFVLWMSVKAIAGSDTPVRTGLLGGVIRLLLLFGSFSILIPSGAKAPSIAAWLAGFLVIRMVTIGMSRMLSANRKRGTR